MWYFKATVVILTLQQVASENTTTDNPEHRVHKKAKPEHEKKPSFTLESLLPFERVMESGESSKKFNDKIKDFEHLDDKKEFEKSGSSRKKLDKKNLFDQTEYDRIKDTVKRESGKLMKQKEDQFAAIKDSYFDRNKSRKKPATKSRPTTAVPDTGSPKTVNCPAGTKLVNGICVQYNS